MDPRPLVVLLTDFGTRDVYVGVMEAVIHGIAPDARVTHLTHAVSPQAVDEGAFLLEQALPYLPRGAVVCAVVDPGVGTPRAAVALETRGVRLVGPDNGLFTPVLERPDLRAHEVTDPELGLPEPSATFHGRDVFAPCAAHLAAGVALEEVGPPRAAGDLVHLAAGAPRVIHVDRFGNLVTTVGRDDVEAGTPLRVGDTTVDRWVRTYGEAAPGEVVVLIGSTGKVEVSVVNGDAAATLGVARGASVHTR